MGKLSGSFGSSTGTSGADFLKELGGFSGSGGASGGSVIARKLLKGGLNGLSKGLDQRQQQVMQGGAPPINIPQAPQYDFSQLMKNRFYGS